MDAPVVKLPCRFSESVEGGRQPQENALQPYEERLDRFCCGTRLGVNFDNVRGVSRTVIFGEAGHRSLLQLFDPFDFSLQTVADVDSETWVFGVKNVPLRAAFEGVGVGLDKVFESEDSSIEF